MLDRPGELDKSLPGGLYFVAADFRQSLHERWTRPIGLGLIKHARFDTSHWRSETGLTEEEMPTDHNSGTRAAQRKHEHARTHEACGIHRHTNSLTETAQACNDPNDLTWPVDGRASVRLSLHAWYGPAQYGTLGKPHQARWHARGRYATSGIAAIGRVTANG